MTLSVSNKIHNILEFIGRQQTQNISSETTPNLNLKSVFTFSHAQDLSLPFCLQSSGEFIVLEAKTDLNVFSLGKQLSSHHHSKFQLRSETIPCSSYNVVKDLKVNQNNIFNKSSHKNKNDIMLNTNLFPDCLPSSQQVMKSQLSPYSVNLPVIIASMSSYGSIQLINYKLGEEEVIESNSHSIIAELCEIRKSEFSLGSYVKLEKLQEIVKELTFYNFDWCPEIVSDRRLIAAMTVSREIIFYEINRTNEVKSQLSYKLDNKSVNTLRWIVHGGRNFLVVADRKGDLSRFSLEVINGEVKSVKEIDKLEGKLKIPMQDIQIDSVGDSLLLLCTKSHSLEIFLLQSSGNYKSISKYIGLSVTGITKISKDSLNYLMTTLNNEIFYMELAVHCVDVVKIQRFEKVENSDMNPEKFNAYGITTSKNKVMTFVALHPRVTTDHLTIKQPLCLSLNLFSLNSPYKILINNDSLKLTEFFDCVEAVRFIGSKRLETLQVLEAMDYEIALNAEFIYYLKVQLIVIDAKQIYYQTRSDSILELMRETELSIRQIIEVINAFIILKSTKTTHKTAVRCLANFIRNYINEEILKEPFKTAQLTFKSELQELLINLPETIIGSAEVCLYCAENIDTDKLTCSENHQMARCAITKLLLPLSAKSFCSICNCSVMNLATLREITGNSDILCPYCDGRFISVQDSL